MILKIDKHIEIVRTNEPGLSSMSRRSCDALLVALKKHYTRAEVTTISTASDLEGLVAKRPDVAFLGMMYLPVNAFAEPVDTNVIWITTYLEAHGITCTGSSQKAHNLERNKPLAKQRILSAGLATSPFYTITQKQQELDALPFTFPAFVKPSNRGGGAGIDTDSVVHNLNDLKSKALSITTDLKADALVEEYLPGREFSVAILRRRDGSGFMTMPLELIAPKVGGVRLLSKAVKNDDAEQAIEITDISLKLSIQALAINAFYALGARDYGRIDIRLDKHGVPNFLEANLLPSLIENYGSFPKACLLNSNLDYESMIVHIVGLALARCQPDELYVTEPEPATALSY